MTRLEKVANVAIVLVCVTMTADLIARRFGGGPAPADASQNAGAKPRVTEYSRGEAFPQVPGLTLAEDKASLILFVKETCRFCTDSMPFYQRLAAIVRDAGSSVQLVGMCPDATEVCSAYLTRHQIAVDQVVGLAPGGPSLKVAGTPTLLLVDQGKVASLWRGQLRADGENEVIAAVTRRRSP